jgi:hypothetical protein
MGVVSPQKLLCVREWSMCHKLLHKSCGGVGLDDQTGAVILCGFQALQVSKTLLHVTSHSVNISDLRCDSLSHPSHVSHSVS